MLEPAKDFNFAVAFIEGRGIMGIHSGIMTGKHIVDIRDWPRRDHYHYFGDLDDPYFGITAKADFTSCYMQAKEDGESFFLYSLHKILRAANAVTEFRYRVEDSGIVLYDLIGASPTIGREDGSFGFGVFEYHEDRTMFVNEAKKEISRVKNASGLCLGEGESRNDLIYYSSIPWIDFTDLKHAGKMSKGQSIPRISTGRLVPHEDKLMMPVSVEINHGLADGYHVAQFFRLLDML